MKSVEQNALNAFTRGGQFLNNFFGMARQNLVRITVFSFSIGIIAGWIAWFNISAPQSRYAMTNEFIMRSTLLFNSDADKDISVKAADGTFTPTTIQRRMSVSHYANDVARMKADLITSTIIGVIFGILFMVLIMMVAVYIGSALSKDKHVRGARLKKPRDVQRAITKYNREEARKQNNYDLVPYTLAGIQYPFRAETQHTMMVGSTGSGKTQGISYILAQVYDRGDRAVLYDKMRSFVERFYDPQRDIILNPLDKRCPAWDIFADARHLVDWENIAEAIIPNENTENTYFESTARSVFAHTAHRVVRRCKEQGKKPKVSDLIFMLTSTTDEYLNEFLQGSPAQLHIDPNNQRTTGSIRSTLGNAIRSLGYLKDPLNDNDGFSIRAWVADDDKASVVYLTSRDDIHAVLQPLLTMWISIFTSAQMSQPRSSKRTIWYMLDELPSLNRLPNLESALAEARQYGAAYLIGIQLISQLRQIYGKDGADTILGLTRSKLVFNPGDPITAELMTQFIGKSEVNRKDHSMSVGVTELRDGQSVSSRLTQEFIIMPEELAQLPSLSGILSFTGDFPVCRITLDYLSLEGPEPGFVEDPDAISRAEDIFTQSGMIDVTPQSASGDIREPVSKPSGIPPVMRTYDAPKLAGTTDVPQDPFAHTASGYAENADIIEYEPWEETTGSEDTISHSYQPQADESPKQDDAPAPKRASILDRAKTQAATPASTEPTRLIPKNMGPKKILNETDAEDNGGEGGGGNTPNIEQRHMEMLESATDANGISPVTTSIATDMRSRDREKGSEQSDDERMRAAQERRRREQELFGNEAQTAMPGHAGRDNAPDHFGGR